MIRNKIESWVYIVSSLVVLFIVCLYDWRAVLLTIVGLSVVGVEIGSRLKL